MTEGGPLERLVYFFGAGRADADRSLVEFVGGKGASLAEMTHAGLNVPPGFTISAACCEHYFRAGKRWPPGLEEEVRRNLARLEEVAGRPFGRGDDPLLVAVRSGAAQSMPGMMDTVLNVGLHPEVVRARAARTGNRRGAWEAYRHFLALFGHTVGGLDEAAFKDAVADALREAGKQAEEELDADQVEALCDRFRASYRRHTGREMPTDPWDLLRQAISAVFDSWNGERAVAYRRHHGIDGLRGTAVNVQAMCPAEVSGVMFTANPVNPAPGQVLVESSFGLGEAVVLGKVTPDRFVLEKQSLKILERTISRKDTVVATLTVDGSGPAARDAASLRDEQVEELARLGLRVEAYFGRPCDIEWALSGGQFYLLQSRAIKGSPQDDGAEREQVRREEIAALAARAEPGGTVWSRYNLAEVLPEPTPMTWSIVRRFLSGRGGYGLMYRDVGFDPDPALDEEGVFDLVCGRPYCNLSREPRMYYRWLPFEHPFAKLKADPRKALYPQPLPNPAKLGWAFWLLLPVKLPLLIWKLTRSELRRQRLSQTFARRFREEVVPAFVADVGRAAAEDLARRDEQALLAHLEVWTWRTLHDFARDSLKPVALAAFALARLERKLIKPLGPERAQAALRELVMGVGADPEANLPAALRDLAAGKLDRAAFLQRFGHRGSQEMELSQPRWAEDPAALDRLVAHAAGAPPAAPAEAWERVAAEAKLTAAQQAGLRGELETLRTYLGLRETAKHYLLMGYAEIRRVLMELDRRHRLGGGIFYLTPDDLPRLVAGEDLSGEIARARRRRQLALGLEVPQVLFSDDLEAVGRPADVSGADTLQGVPLSAGVAEAPALVLLDPAQAVPPEGPYVLVCPSTDPAWVPLFVRAKGLVMETGGVLSHGAIVAREFGLPAVAGLPGVHRRLRTGQRLRVEGGTGRVRLLPD